MSASQSNGGGGDSSVLALMNQVGATAARLDRHNSQRIDDSDRQQGSALAAQVMRAGGFPIVGAVPDDTAQRERRRREEQERKLMQAFVVDDETDDGELTEHDSELGSPSTIAAAPTVWSPSPSEQFVLPARRAAEHDVHGMPLKPGTMRKRRLAELRHDRVHPPKRMYVDHEGRTHIVPAPQQQPGSTAATLDSSVDALVGSVERRIDRHLDAAAALVKELEQMYEASDRMRREAEQFHQRFRTLASATQPQRKKKRTVAPPKDD